MQKLEIKYNISIIHSKLMCDVLYLTIHFSIASTISIETSNLRPQLGWQIFSFDKPLTTNPCCEGRIDTHWPLIPDEIYTANVNISLKDFLSGDYLIRVDWVLEGAYWFHQKNGEAAIYAFHISHPQIEIVSDNQWDTFSLPLTITDTGHHIFAVSNHITHSNALPLCVRLSGSVMFDWDIASNTSYLWGREIATGQAIIDVTLPAGIVNHVEDIQNAIELRHSFQPNLVPVINKEHISNSFMIFYYPWYRTALYDAAKDLAYNDWERHRWFLNDKNFGLRRDIFPRPGFAIQSSHWPFWGIHSSASDYILQQDLGFIAWAGIGVVICSWWPSGTVEDTNFKKILTIAADIGLKVCCLIESFENVHGQSADGYNEMLDILNYLQNTHFQNEAYLKFGKNPVVFEWGSEHIEFGKSKWIETNKAFNYYKNNNHDGLVLIALSKNGRSSASQNSPADYFYNYEMHNIDMMRYPLNTIKENLLPSIGPGYDERCIPSLWRPQQRFTDRKMGRVYDMKFSQLYKRHVTAINIVSYNELAEGTSIIPSLPRCDMLNNTEGHFGASPGVESQFSYLSRTKYWLEKLHHRRTYLSFNEYLSIFKKYHQRLSYV